MCPISTLPTSTAPPCLASLHMPKSHRRRRGQKRPVRPVVRIHSEGTVTEVDLLTEWFRETRKVSIEWVTKDQGRLKLVDNARNDLSRSDLLGFDHLWCVFDDDRDKLALQALDKARQGGVNVAFSNPCIEIWLVLHGKDQRGAIGGPAAQSEAHRLKFIDDKHIRPEFFEQMQDNYELARDRAQKLDGKHALDDSPPHSNPSTNIWRLIDLIRTGSPSPSPAS